MKSMAIILTREPYGLINAAEAVRHALGAVSDDIAVSLLLTDGGVMLCIADQNDTGTGFTNLGAALKDCIDMGVSVSAEAESIKSAGLSASDMIEGVQTINQSAVAGIIKQADHTMIY